MKKISNIIVWFIIMILISCQSGTKVEPRQVQKSQGLPGLDIQAYKNLIENCELIDYIFHDLPFSMSQDHRSSIVTNLQFISSSTVDQLNRDCKSTARIMYSVNGEIVTEAELYFSEGCIYFVFVKDEKPYAANLMTEKGIVFYNNIINQVKTSIPNAQGSSN